ncbi:integrase [Rhizobium sp. G21]|uniref:tyrosine-type recombinase/integrase n=1 Tax=Rhizobium sp. G21 TaxID=2758439 RepID=UPI0016009D9E|nr:integrase [Rhizobium sp. G21]MBB1247425.1 integrase [Rhizobium sp. G21]
MDTDICASGSMSGWRRSIPTASNPFRSILGISALVVKVRLKGLNIRQARGRWYVSYRATGESLVKGFEGTREQLERHMSSHAFRLALTMAETRDRAPTYAEGTLGALIEWFKSDCPRWEKLKPASQEDYQKTFDYLEKGRSERFGPLLDTQVSLINQPAVYQLRNAAAKEKWGRFADKMVSHLSTLFKEAVKVGKLPLNPAHGVEKLHDADPNANHEWTEDEVQTAIWLAPDHLLTPLILARYQGFRGQTCADLAWGHYARDEKTGMAFTIRLRKNNEQSWFPCATETRRHLDTLSKKSPRICLNSDGKPWASEKVMQGAVSDYLTGLKADGLIREGCTLHGLRVTYAASIRRRGFDTGIVADALGDRSRRMGEHYTRHVEKELGRLKVFRRSKG